MPTPRERVQVSYEAMMDAVGSFEKATQEQFGKLYDNNVRTAFNIIKSQQEQLSILDEVVFHVNEKTMSDEVWQDCMTRLSEIRSRLQALSR